MSVPKPSSGTLQPPLLSGPVGKFAAWLYGREISRRNRRWDLGKGVVAIDRPVVSVGNLSVGGTGKTPMVETVVGWLRDAGFRSCIAMRGYASANGESDEAELYRRLIPEVAVVAQPDRLEGLLALFAGDGGDGIDCVVLDDGFQHRRIARGMDIVLLDATRNPWEDRLLPAGWLREPVESLKRASAIVVTHSEAAGTEITASLVRRAREYTGVVAACGHRWGSLVSDQGGTQQSIGVDALRGKRVVAACAIGNPVPFIRQSEEAVGGTLSGTLVLPDHDRFGPAAMARLCDLARGADMLLVTEKDWSKLRHHPKFPCDVFRPRLRLEFVSGQDELRKCVVERVRSGLRGE